MKSIFINKHRSTCRAYTYILRLQTMRNIYEHCRNDDYPGTKVTQGSIMLCPVRMKNYSSCTSDEQPLRCAGRYVTLCGTSLCSFVALYWRPPLYHWEEGEQNIINRYFTYGYSLLENKIVSNYFYMEITQMYVVCCVCFVCVCVCVCVCVFHVKRGKLTWVYKK